MAQSTEMTVTLGANIRDFMSKMSQVGEQMQTVGQEMQGIGESMTASISAPIAGIGVVAMMAAADSDKALSIIQSGLSVTGDEAQELAGLAEKMWKDNWGDSIDDVAEKITVVKKNLKLIKGDELEGAIINAQTLSDKYEIDIAESTRTADKLMKNFNMTQQEAFDMITHGFENGLNYADDYLDTLSEYSVYFSTLGFSGEEFFNKLAAGAEMGAFNLDYVADAVKEFGIRSKDMSKGSMEAFAALGLSGQEMSETFAKGGPKAAEAFQMIVDKIKGVKSETEKNAIAVALFGTKYEDLEAGILEAFSSTKNYMEGSKNATKDAGDALYNNFGAKFEDVKRDAIAALIPIGKILIQMALDVMPKIASAIEKVSTWFKNLSPTGQKLAVVFGLILAAAGPIVMVIGGMVAAFGALMSPVALIIAGVVLLGLAFAAAWATSEKFRNIVTTVFNAIKTVVTAVLGAVVGFVGEQLGVMKAFFDENGAEIMAALKNVWSVISVIFKVAFAIIVAIVQGTWNNIKGMIRGAVQVILGIIKVFSSLFTGNWKGVWEGIKMILKGVLEFLWNYIQLIFVGKILKVFAKFIGAALKAIGGWVKGMVGKVKDMGRGVADKVEYMWSMVKSKFNLAVRSTQTTISGWSQAIGNLFRAVVDTIRIVFKGVLDVLTAPFKKAWDIITGIVSKIKGAFNNLVLKIPKPKLPHVSVSMKTKKVGPVSIPYPDFNLDWYKKGGMFNGASVIGVGEQPGVKEVAMPLSGKHMLPFAKAVAKNMEGGGGGGEYYFENVVVLDGREVSRQTVKYDEQEMQRMKRKRGRAKGEVYFD